MGSGVDERGGPVGPLRLKARARIGIGALAIEQEKELVIDPLFFRELQWILPRITGMEVMAKRSAANNELTRYRYDVVLRVGEPESAMDGLPPLDCRAENLDLPLDAVATQRLLETADDDEMVEHVQNRLAACDTAPAWSAGAESPASRRLSAR